jgi:hypothetical protein
MAAPPSSRPIRSASSGLRASPSDRAYPSLDARSSLEEELVGVSRGREVANVCTVATSELLDPELGPSTRELTDSIQDVREAIEREGADFPAFELGLRERIDALSSQDWQRGG